MSTNATIAIENEDGSVTGVYLHWDGYIEHAGKTLFEHFNTEEKIRELISFGSISSLGTSIEDTTFYSRDRGEDLNIYEYGDFEEFMDKVGEEFNYLFFDGRWVWDRDELENTLNELVD